MCLDLLTLHHSIRAGIDGVEDNDTCGHEREHRLSCEFLSQWTATRYIMLRRLTELARIFFGYEGRHLAFYGVVMVLVCLPQKMAVLELHCG